MEFIEQGNVKNDKYDFIFKFMILGLSDVGKTLILNRIVSYNNYSKFIQLKKETVPTIGLDFKDLTIKYKNKLILIGLRDPSGAVPFDFLISSYYIGRDVFLLCYDAYNRDSFNYIKKNISK